MTRMIHCIKLDKELEGLERQTYPGDLGQRIFDSISKQAWQDWMKQQTILINEHRLSVIEPKAREFLETEMENYLFGTSDKS